MTPPGTLSRTPAPALAAAVLAVLGGLVLLWLAFVLYALGGLSSDGSGRAWALLPAAAGAATLVGGVVLLRRRVRWPLAAGAVLAAAFVVLLVVQAAAMGEDPPVVPVLLVLGGPVLALALASVPVVRSWSAGRR